MCVIYVLVRVRLCVSVRLCVCARERVRACMRACVGKLTIAFYPVLDQVHSGDALFSVVLYTNNKVEYTKSLRTYRHPINQQELEHNTLSYSLLKE